MSGIFRGLGWVYVDYGSGSGGDERVVRGNMRYPKPGRIPGHVSPRVG